MRSERRETEGFSSRPGSRGSIRSDDRKDVMTCQEARLLLTEELAGNRGGSSESHEHLAVCPACAAEAEQVRTIWLRLADVPEPETRPGMSTRFYAALDAYQQGMREQRSGFWRWWPSRPVWQVAVSMG